MEVTERVYQTLGKSQIPTLPNFQDLSEELREDWKALTNSIEQTLQETVNKTLRKRC